MIQVRDATPADLAALVEMRDSRSQFVDYLDRADADSMRFLVYERDRQVVAFAVLYLRQPPRGRLAAELPRISDLFVAEARRSSGIGADFIGRMDQLTLAAGFDVLHISVDPVDNPRAAALYKRLGYAPLSPGPYRKLASWEDEEGRLSEIEYWRMDLLKRLK